MSRRNRERREKRRASYLKLPGRTVELTPQSEEAIQRQLARFREKFGRDAEPDEPVFFDPKYDTPTAFTQERWDEHIQEEIARMPEHVQPSARAFFAEWNEISRNGTDDEYQQWCKKMRQIMGEE